MKKKDIKFSEIKRREGLAVVVSNKKFVGYLSAELGIRKYSENKNLPINFLEFSERIVGSIISGIIDGDGVIRNDDKWVSRVNIRLTSKTLLSQVQQWLNIQNINSSLCSIGGYGERESRGLKIKPSKQLYSLTQVAFPIFPNMS